MDATILSSRLQGKVEDIIKILVALGCNEKEITIHNNGKYLTTKRIAKNADNKNGLVVYTDTLKVLQTTHGRYSGNLYTLTMDTKKCSFPQALRFISNVVNFESSVKVSLPFNGFWKGITKDRDGNYNLHLHHYKESDLPSPDNLSYRYLKDGVDLQTQELFGVRYSFNDNAILTPVRDYEGGLVGCKGRKSDKDCSPNNRFFMKLPYSKSLIVYGWTTNYAPIIKKQCVLVFEAEKSVMQCYSFGVKNALAIGGHNISAVQAHYLKSLGTKNVVVAFDEGIDLEEAIYECKKLKTDNPLLNNKLYVLYDKEHRFLQGGSKDSPSDNGRAVFENLMKNCLIEV